MNKLLVLVIPLLLCTGCVREYHESAKTLRAVCEVEGTDGLPEPHKSALEDWCKKRDKFWELPNAAINAYKAGKELKNKIDEAKKERGE